MLMLQVSLTIVFVKLFNSDIELLIELYEKPINNKKILKCKMYELTKSNIVNW